MAERLASSLPALGAQAREAYPVNGHEIGPGDLCALASAEPGKPLRPVTAIRVTGPFLIYAGPSGAEWAADMSRVMGPWPAHAAAGTTAKAAARALRDRLACEAINIVEAGYC